MTEDELGIVYLIDNAQLFWSGKSYNLCSKPAISLIITTRTRGHSPEATPYSDSRAAGFDPKAISASICQLSWGVYIYIPAADRVLPQPEQYLQSPLQLEHACDLLLDSELFAFHSERMSEILVAGVQTVCFFRYSRCYTFSCVARIQILTPSISHSTSFSVMVVDVQNSFDRINDGIPWFLSSWTTFLLR